MMTRDTNPEAALFDIFAIDGSGQAVHCFTWRLSAQGGIERAKRDAVDFGRTDLHGFWAAPVTDPARLSA